MILTAANIAHGPGLELLDDVDRMGDVLGVVDLHYGRARPQAAIHAMEDILERGNTLIIVPEGGIGPGDGRVRPLQSGTAYLAQRTGYPILTVGITGSDDLWWRKRVTVRIGPCIDPAHFVEGTARARRTALLADLRAQIQALLVRERAHHGPTLLRKTLTNLF